MREKSEETDSVWKKLNLNPDGELISDCSTRTLAFCLEKTSKEDYRKIKDKQLEIAMAISGKKSDWNAHYVFESILLSKNWFKTILLKKIPRRRLAELYKKVPVKILTESYEHISPIYLGKIYDTWDCSRGRVGILMAPLDKSSEVLKVLEKNSIQYALE